MKMQGLKALASYIIILSCILVVPLAPLSAQESSSESSSIDVSEKNLQRLYKLQDYYRAQLKKGTMNDKLREKYTKGLEETEKEIDEIKEKRLSYAKRVSLTDPALLEREKFNFQFREMDLALSANETSRIYSVELKSLLVNAGVSFLSVKNYSAPFTLSAEKLIAEKISVGGYLGHFIEKVRDKENYLDSNFYFSANKANYKHNYINIGLRGSYHFFSPTFFLDAEHFDLYVTAMVGYIMSTSTFPFLENEKDLPYNRDGSSVTVGEDGEYLKPNKSGINYGAFAGLRYMYDNNLGFFVEAGYSNTAFATAGITLRFLSKKASNIDGTESVEFKVKLFASEKRKRPGSRSFKGLDMQNIEEIQVKKEFMYVMTAENTSYGAATILQIELSKKFKKSQVIAFKEGKMISMGKALKILKKSGNEPAMGPGSE